MGAFLIYHLVKLVERDAGWCPCCIVVLSVKGNAGCRVRCARTDGEGGCDSEGRGDEAESEWQNRMHPPYSGETGDRQARAARRRPRRTLDRRIEHT